MENEFYDIRVVPVLKKIKDENNKISYIDNFTSEELKNISSPAVMLWDFGTDVYFAELPLTFRGNHVSEHLFYIYDMLTLEEQEKYYDKSIIVKTTRPKVTMIYGVNKNNTEKKEKNYAKKRVKKNSK